MNGDVTVDLRTDSEYSGRVQYHCDNNICTLRITDLRESDSAEYKFRFITNQPGGSYTGLPGVTLLVTGLQVLVSITHPTMYPTWRELKCQSSCRLPDHPSYVWYKNGQKIPTVTSSSYSGYFYSADSYSCAVKGHEDSPSPSVCVFGQSCNRVTYTDRSICAFKGSSVDISSNYNSHKTIRSKFWFSSERIHQWQSPSQSEDLSEDSQYAGRVQVLETERGRSTLRITDLRESDSAQYRFKFTAGSFEWNSILPGTTLTVTALQVQVTRIKVYQSYTEAELKCHSSCSPDGRLSYVWFRNRTEIPLTEMSIKYQFYSGDIITCALKGHENYSSPSVYHPKLPSVSVSPSGEIVDNSTVTLTCSSVANPAANYTWYKKNGDPDLHPLSKEPQLVFRSIQSSDSGEYYCTAENKLGRRTSQYISINVKYGPKLPSVSVSPSGELVEGSSVNLTCSSDANPAANYTWFKKNGDPDLHPPSKEPQLVFRSIQSSDSGEYNCTAENELGRRTSQYISINVKYAPRVPSVSVCPSGEIVDNSTVTLTCSSDANPAANYTWYKKNGDPDLHPLSKEPQLVFRSIRSSDSG
uniref:B-cell receptor CD22 n=1 Tax=Dicentrarchus labrax TaxID=13489 RepID=A0A8C4HWC4_DICLA